MKKTSVINPEMKMADVIHLDYTLLPVINRFGISLGFGDRTIESLCNKNGINLDFFLEILNAFHDPDYFPEEKLKKYPIGLLIDYLKKTHDYYMDVKVPELEKLISRLVDTSVEDSSRQALLTEFFADYEKQLTEHIEREEEKVYPYILALEKAVHEKDESEETSERLDQYSIDHFTVEHDDVEEKLLDLKNIIIKYLPPPGDSNLCNTVLFLLFELEKDLNDHSRIEDTIMVPMVEDLEKQYKKISKS